MEGEKKSSYRGYTQARNKASQKYHKENLEQLNLSVKKGTKEVLRSRVQALGYTSFTAFVLEAINEKIERESKTVCSQNTPMTHIFDKMSTEPRIF